MRVFVDFHHHALYESLRLLFEERFGWELYRPIGMDWFDQELWNYERHSWGADVAHQYLDLSVHDFDHGDHISRPNKRYPNAPFKMVTLEQFRAQRWDYVIATLDHNEPAYAKLAAEKGARFGIEIGNQWGFHDWSLQPFVLSAVKPDPWPTGIEGITLRQEFDLGQFRYEPPRDFGQIASWMQCLPEGPVYTEFKQAARLAPEFDWRVYGAYGTAPSDEFAWGDFERVDQIAELMRNASVGYHAKRFSDGYGHVIHNFFALGRPVFAWTSYYDGRWDGERRIAADLFIEGVTSIDITGRPPEYVVDKLRELARDQDRWLRMCEETAAHFRRTVDFEAEADAAHILLTGEHAVAA